MAALAGSSRRVTTSSKQLLHRRVLADALLELAPQPDRRELHHLVREVAPAALLERALGLDVLAVLARASRRAPPRPRRCEASVRTIGTRQLVRGPSERTPRISRIIVSVSGWSALLTTITSGISITPALSAWIESPEPGISTSTTVSAWSMMSTSACPTPTVSRKHVVLARGVHQQRRLERGLGQAAERAAARHRADEDAGVEEVVGEPDAVAEQRALRERRRRVDRQHGHVALALARVLHERADQRRLADAGRPGEARPSSRLPVFG